MTHQLLFVSGSQRRESHNQRLLNYLSQQLDGHCVIDILMPADVGLPLFDQDLEDQPDITDRLEKLHQRINACDGIVIATPEYNGQLPPYLKNLVDWVSRLPRIDSRFSNPFFARPVLLCSASTGWSGGALAIPHARALFGYLGSIVAGDTICLPYADEAWDGEGYVFEPGFDAQLRTTALQFLTLCAALPRMALTGTVA